jgi:anti-sigma-K factor RskA
MNLLNNPALLDQLAASYALGTLRGGARRRFETLARQSPTIRSAALLWHERFTSITELQTADAPSPNVWKRIENTLSAQRLPAPALATAQNSSLLDNLRRSLSRWRGAALAGGLATAAAVVVGVNLSGQLSNQSAQLAQAAQQNTQLTARLAAAPEIQYVAVLADDKADASVLVTFDPKNQKLTLKRVGSFQETADQSLQLWALKSGGPQSLGVLGSDKVIRLTAAEGQVREVPTLAISLEPKGGAPVGSGPTGPVLFKGALIQTTL